jgi:hypothetical protein
MWNIAMNKAILLIALAAVAAPSSAGAMVPNSLMAKPSTPSLLYVGFDKMDASGNPVCDSCAKKDAEAKDWRTERFARRGLPTVVKPESQTANAAPAPSAPAAASQKQASANNQPAPEPTTTISPPGDSTSSVGDGVMRGAMR